MKKLAFRFGVLIAVAVVGYFLTARVFVLRHKAVFNAGIVKAAGIPVVPRTVDVLENGQVHTTRSVRSDGSYSSLKSVVRPDGTFLVGDIHYTKDGWGVTRFGDIKATHSFYPSPTAPSAHGLSLLDPATDCTRPFIGNLIIAPTILGNEEILGYRVVHVKETMPTATLEKWLAPDLGCEEMKSTVNSTLNGKARYAERHVVSVTLGEPDASLFSIPQGYVEMTPEQADQAFADKYENGKVDTTSSMEQSRRSARYAQFGPKGQFAPK